MTWTGEQVAVSNIPDMIAGAKLLVNPAIWQHSSIAQI